MNDLLVNFKYAQEIIGEFPEGKLKIKLGIDPTSNSLHLGHYVLLRTLKGLSHDVKIIVGDYTARIGDPSGKNAARPKLSIDDIADNSCTIENQIMKILPNAYMDNNTYLDEEEIIKYLDNITVQQMLAKEDFKNRYTEGKPIFMNEFLYPVLQGIDSYVNRINVELGGIDQKFNVLMGREIQKANKHFPQVAVLYPLLPSINSSEKMSKSVGNVINIDDPEMYSKLRKVPDDKLEIYFNLLLGKDLPDTDNHTRSIMLAEKVTEELLEKPKVPVITNEYASVLDMVAAVKNCSKSEAKRLIKQGALKRKGQKISNIQEVPFSTTYTIGKHTTFEIR